MINHYPLLRKWAPAIVMMLAIFILSSIPSKEIPHFFWADTILKKGGHMLGYGLLALCYSYGLALPRRTGWLPWLLALIYAVTDEFHQSFVPGRNPSLLDVGIDAIGAGLALLIEYTILKLHR